MHAARAAVRAAGRGGSASIPSRWRGASTTSSTRTWRARRACTSPSAAAIRATTRSSARAARARCTPASVARKLGVSRVDLSALGGRGLGAGPARGAGAGRSRGHRGHSTRSRRAWRSWRRPSARLEDEARAVMADTGLKLENAADTAARRRPLHGPGLRSGGGAPRRAVRRRGADSRRRLAGAFETAYREKFALTPPGVPVEFLNIRVAVRAPVSGSEVVLRGQRGAARRARAQGNAGPHTSTRRGDSWTPRSTIVSASASGDELAGPAVVEEEGSTLVVGPGWVASVAPTGNIIVSVAPQIDPLAPGGGEGRVRGVKTA